MHQAPSTISIATWNVNSVRQRLPHLLEWLKRDKTDIVLLQETKCVDEAFPRMEIEDLGYNIALHGEKSYNGVAILSRFPLDDITRGLPGDKADTQARYIEAVANIGIRHRASGIGESSLTPNAQRPMPTALRVASVYVPNGQTMDSEKFPYKLAFLERLHAHAQMLRGYEEMLAIGGDYNIAPYAPDVHAPERWEHTVLFSPPARDALRRMLNDGFYDAFRMAEPMEPGYTWWDYRGNGLAVNNGLRIDHLLLSPQAADRLTGCRVLKHLREMEKASDHAPVMAELSC